MDSSTHIGSSGRRRPGPATGREALVPFLAGLAGLLVGGTFGRSTWDALSGVAIAVLLVGAHRMRGRIDALGARIVELEQQPRAATADDAAAAAPAEPAAPARPAPEAARGTETAPPAPSPRPAFAARTADRVADTPRSTPAGPGPVARGATFVRELLLGGNTVVRVGVMVLLVGISLLAKWAADHALFPIEARLAAASLIGLGLVVVGYRLRDARPGFGTTLQGGGIAALYLVVFSALKIFALVPAPLAFVLFVALAVACGLLAVLQRSEPLLFIGSLGGFAAPVIASTGSGNHVVLFSYYLLLVAAIAAVALRRTWRAVNLLAFVATYGVATTWGVLRYTPEHFASTAPFVLAFMALFTGIALVYAWRQPPRLAGLVDGTLVFGTPLFSLLFMARLLEDTELGLAYCAAGFGAYYAVLATWLWRSGPAQLRQLAEAFVALAVGFGTMAIPFAVETGVTTALLWSLEGAGLYWVGVRQGRGLARASGIALQVLAALALDLSIAGRFAGDSAFALANGRFMARLALALAGLFIAREAYVARDRLTAWEARLGQAPLVWGLLWWAGAVVPEIERFVASPYQHAAIAAAIGASALVLERASTLFSWQPAARAAIAAIPAAFLVLVDDLFGTGDVVTGAGWLAWPLAVAAIFAALLRAEVRGDAVLTWALAPAAWLTAAVLGAGLHGVAGEAAGLDGDWKDAAFGVGVALTLLAGLYVTRREGSTFARHARHLVTVGGGPIAGGLALWWIAANFSATGASAPLPYLPLLSPTDVALAVAAVALLSWHARARAHEPNALIDSFGPILDGAWPALGFVWLNGMIARSVHQWTDVPFQADALWASTPLQVALSIAWTAAALAGMWVSTQRGLRRPWLVGAALLGTVVVKLFLVDLSQLGTGAKIVSFLVVGGLLLVVGYLSPVPPAPDDEAPAEPPLGGPATESERPA